MARTALTPKVLTTNGSIDPSSGYVNGDATNGHSVPAGRDGMMFLHVKNGGGSSINVTVKAGDTLWDHVAYADLVVAVGASGQKMIGPFESNKFKQLNGNINIDLSGDTSVTIAAIRLPVGVLE